MNTFERRQSVASSKIGAGGQKKSVHLRITMIVTVHPEWYSGGEVGRMCGDEIAGIGNQQDIGDTAMIGMAVGFGQGLAEVDPAVTLLLLDVRVDVLARLCLVVEVGDN